MTTPIPPDNPDARPLLHFAAVAVPTGWLLLTPPVLLDLPMEPFVLLTLLVGLVAPALLLTRAGPGRGLRPLLRDTVRRPSPWWIVVPAATLVPAVTWAWASLLGVGRGLDGGVLTGLAISVVTSVLIVNLWEEMAWTGFVQRRAIARWGAVVGSLVTAALFVGIHLPLAFADGGTVRAVSTGLGALLVSGVGLRLLIGAADTWSGRSLPTVALLHASFNVSGDVVAPGHDWIRYAVTLTLGLLALAAPAVRAGGRRATAASDPKMAAA